MKKIIYVLFFMFLLFTAPAYALVTFNFESGNYHVVYINDLGTSTSCSNGVSMNYDSTNIEYLKSFDKYDDAINYMKTIKSLPNKTLVIIGEKKNTDGVYVNDILTSEYALVDLNTTGTTSTTSYVYKEETSSRAYTYINGHGMFGGVDAALIDYSNEKSRAKMMIAGVTGWIDSILYLDASGYDGFDIVPLSVVKSPSYYYVNGSNELVHRLSRKITANNCYATSLTLGPAPSSLKQKDENDNMIKYYSYDGIYFYTSLESMLNDYKNGININAVNKIPYYNYYMYLPVRSKTNITSDNIRNYLESRNYTSKDKSVLYGEELTFIDAENKYGVNAITSFSTAINESGWGTSYLARTKNNVFGHNAFDSSVMESASKYKNVSDGIYRHAYYMINAGFAETKDAVARYYGSHLGNKNSGVNVKYASDPYWGEKIASYYYSIDNYSDLKDYKSVKIGIKVTDTPVPVKKEANNSSLTLYKLESYYNDVSNMSVVILDKVAGEAIDGNSTWYKIQTDALLNENRDDLIRDTTINDHYNWDNNYGYVHSSYITLMDENVNNEYIKKDGLFALEELSLTEDKKIKIKGYLAITGMDNTIDKNITYDLIVENDNKSFSLPLERITDLSNINYKVPDKDYDYTYSWFTGIVDLKDIDEGNYNLFIRARSGEYESKEVLSDLFSKKTVSKYTDLNNKGYQFRTNYYLKTIPIELFIRNNGLINDKVTPTSDNMINQYQSISLENGLLKLYGSSFNVGGNYNTSVNVERSIIFENITTYERYKFDLGYIDNGEYKITLLVPDNLDKTRAWFNKSIDISNLNKGTYAIYIETKTNVEDYGELNDIFQREIKSTMSCNDKTYSLKINDKQRFRVELEIK